MATPIVILESPFAPRPGDDPAVNASYLSACLADSISRGEAPFASHGLYTRDGVLDDTDPEARRIGVQTGFAFRRVAGKSAFYIDRGFSRGMLWGLEDAVEVVRNSYNSTSTRNHQIVLRLLPLVDQRVYSRTAELTVDFNSLNINVTLDCTRNQGLGLEISRDIQEVYPEYNQRLADVDRNLDIWVGSHSLPTAYAMAAQARGVIRGRVLYLGLLIFNERWAQCTGHQLLNSDLLELLRQDLA